MRNKAYISLGSNVGNRVEYLQEAVRMLGQQEEISLVSISSIYETDPVGYVEQDPFFKYCFRGVHIFNST